MANIGSASVGGEDAHRMSSIGIAIPAVTVEMGCVPTEVFQESNHRMSSIGISIPAVAAEMAMAIVTEVEQVRCECCGLAEECTPAYIARVRSSHRGRWVCGLCAEAVKEEHRRAGAGSSKEGLDEGLEEALEAHMSLCMKFNKPEGMGSPVADITAAMRRLLRLSANGRRPSPRSAPSSPNRRYSINRATSCVSSFSRGFEAPL